ncbi:uncharacterized protein LAESUDRAFT_715703 [Laetiporus sulphureus 93-53]|uniref:DUF6534 domain-containing protein n=1 Tax=Laetiporus sulphureus 93-53 TaxID=1314785 RepID=A0A165D4R7_9APHY|nr:uncharacterized protein LAESUDRAFT_715703 [Laetiporus sulphureus 93-53]KZT04149.1 hypothetical protein LAESUDRAFT_715703 [Laetiporus sulphureus 93-53]
MEARLELNTSLGCYFIGVLFAILFNGITCAQALYYVRHYPEDTLQLKTLLVWDYLITGHADIASVTSLPRYIATSEFHPCPIVMLKQGFTVLTVQCYYVHNVWKLLREKWFKVPAIGLMHAPAKAHILAIPIVFVKMKVPASLQTLSASVTDVLITVFMTWALNREPVSFGPTESLVRKLTVYAINCGILTVIVQILQFIMYTAFNASVYYWAVFHFPGNKIYVNSMLALLGPYADIEARANSSPCRYEPLMGSPWDTGVSYVRVDISAAAPSWRIYQLKAEHGGEFLYY